MESVRVRYGETETERENESGNEWDFNLTCIYFYYDFLCVSLKCIVISLVIMLNFFSVLNINRKSAYLFAFLFIWKSACKQELWLCIIYLWVSTRSGGNDGPADAFEDDDENVKHCDSLNISLCEFAMQLCTSNIKQRVISYLTGEIFFLIL